MLRLVLYANILSGLTAGILPAQAERLSAAEWASLVGQRFRAERDVVYRTVDGMPLKLDFYVPYDRKPGPTILYIHGGGWQTGSKEQYVLWYLPYLELGMRVVAVQYRLSGAAPAPAAVEDCRCAFRWVYRHGVKYGVDPRRIVVSGGSAGGHLSLVTAMADTSFDGACPDAAGEAPRAAAVINYYGPTDMEMVLRTGKPSIKNWMRGVAEPEALARRMSPLTWVRRGGPPVLTLHGDADQTVPYEHATRLHRALDRAGVPNQLVTVPGGQHGRHTWTDADTLAAQRAIESFLRRHNLIDLPPRSR